MNSKYPLYFIILALGSLLLGVIFGLVASLQYIYPEFLKNALPFIKLRPLHVTSGISWIILGAIGSIYFYLNNLKFYSVKLLKTHFTLYLLTGISLYFSYVLGNMDGREYLAFTPFLIIPILFGWLLFGINLFKTLWSSISNWPVYYWMWGTGIVFMIYHLSEAHFWLIEEFRMNFTKDMAVQWKSYGSFTGSWNMLVYGISIYVMTKIKGDEQMGRSNKAFFFYFLGLTNLMFGWAHHTYFLPTQPWIRYVAYIVSMSEWIVLASIIYDWRRGLPIPNFQKHSMAIKLMKTADFWIFANLVLALLISIPAINYYTHGTHITVAHSMGTTIGINTTILFSSIYYIVGTLNKKYQETTVLQKVSIKLFNGALIVFVVSLLAAGIKRSHWIHFSDNSSFSEMQDAQYVVYILLTVSGLGLLMAIYFIAIPVLKRMMQLIRH
ncbi:cbb3-type cytochrome c oxidase subunit I [Winogradskyella jejuensis]|uniref:Nitric oxide reductase, NorB subunit apoprotein n=1 Tax=Winogradskyella jejuensis TaxID=1089305 RepID=A0A1M5KUT2_9FLAO|nr:cbb3-type cytochrome c oxidase subunit I [Winogradskyella jejuensis]SHG56496.1 nitric oxide reductase, NorB subunit apoprotein [Winogradskyella jejuensis]